MFVWKLSLYITNNSNLIIKNCKNKLEINQKNKFKQKLYNFYLYTLI